MIFITVGTTHFPFDRMEQVFREVCRIRKNNELVVFQHGATSVTVRGTNVVLAAYMAFDTTSRYLHQARVVICHGGPATIYQALLYKKKPWVLPRKKCFREHVDDHQVCFCDFMEKRRFVRMIDPLKNLPLNFSSTGVPLKVSIGPDKKLFNFLSSLS